MNLRNTQRNMQLTLETRQAQFFMELYEKLGSEENQRKGFEVYKMEWKDFDDWKKKYDWTVNEDAYAKFVSHWRGWDSIGFVVYNNLVDPVKIYELQGTVIISRWERFKELIIGIRERSNNPLFLKFFEYLYNEMVKLRGISVNSNASFNPL